jgi:KaiC/GvpD/RAD55 family RecA-like ATPase
MVDRRLVHVWPKDKKQYESMFNKLKDAYVKARYSKRYVIGETTLAWLGEQAQELARVVREICKERLLALENEIPASMNSAVAERA